MINSISSARIFLVMGVTDMRRSFNGLYGIVRKELNAEPLDGDMYVFCNRLRDRVKILYWDQSGFWVCAKRLETGLFCWPDNTVTHVEYTYEQMAVLLRGTETFKRVKK